MKLLSFYLTALALLENKISFIPIRPGTKSPGHWDGHHWTGLNNWTQYNKRFPTEKEIDLWGSWPNPGIGVVLGKQSNLVAIDYDNRPECWKPVLRTLTESPIHKKGEKGLTVFYRYNGEKNDKWVDTNGETVIDLLSDGRQTLIPPTIHPAGMSYEWLKEDTLPAINKNNPPGCPEPEAIDDILEGFTVFSSRSRSQYASPESGYIDDDFDIEDAENALKTISPDVDNETWVKIGMGLKSAFGYDGLKIWNDWSSKGSKYKEDEPTARWRSFKGGAVTLKFLFKLAAEDGYKRELDFVKLNTPTADDFVSLWPGEDKTESVTLTEEEKKISVPKSKKSNVIDIQTKRPINEDELDVLLAAIPENCSEMELPGMLEPVFLFAAKSNGTSDVGVVNRIAMLWDFVKSDHKKAYKTRIKEVRKEIARGEAVSSDSDDGDTKQAKRAAYWALFEGLPRIKDPMMCILTEELTYIKDKEGKRSNVCNILRQIKSDVIAFQEKNKDLKFMDGRVENHFYAWTDTFKPRLCINIPKWDNRDRIQELADLIILCPDFIASSNITHEIFVEFLKDWIARMWIKLYYPTDMDAQNRLFLLVGQTQGQGKDRWLEHLLGGFGQYAPFMNLLKNEKDNKTQLHDGVALVISEFDKTAVMESAVLKAIITESSTNIRKSYDRRAEYRYVRSSLISTCNKHPNELLKDWTGNRRFLPFVLVKVKWITTNIEFRLQVLAQGIELGRDRVFASKESEKIMATYQNVLTPDSPEDEIREAFDNLMEMHSDRLTLDGKSDRVDEWQRAGNDKFIGYCSNSQINEMKIIEAIVQRTKYPNRKIIAALKHDRSHRNNEGKIIPRRIGSVPCRGFYFQPVGDVVVEDVDYDLNVPF